jgi:alanyl-tRNA synthetase
MDRSEYELSFFRKSGFRRRTCAGCGSAFWSLGDFERCQERPCTPISFIGASPFSRSLDSRAMRETYLAFFERRGHTRVRRYPIVARWRNDVFFVQASIYDFQPWVTGGVLPPPANPLVLSQPCVRFVDLDAVGREESPYFTEFEMMAHHAFNAPGAEVYFKDRCVELCHEFYTSELGAGPERLSYKEEEWEGGGNLGPSLSVGVAGLEVATLVFMEYVRDGSALKPMPLTIVDTGYGLERNTWVARATPSAYEANFGKTYGELASSGPASDAAVLVDHARALNFLLTDGVVPSNTQEGYFARLLVRRALRVLAHRAETLPLPDLLDAVGREMARDHPEIGENRADLRRVVEAEVERYDEAMRRARDSVRRQESRLRAEGRAVGADDLVSWYDSLGLSPDVAVEQLEHPPPVPDDFYARVAARHERDRPHGDYAEDGAAGPEVPAQVPATDVRYYTDPYTSRFRARALWTHGPFAVLDRTYFYPTGGGQISDTGSLGGIEVVEVVRRGPYVLHRLASPATFSAGDEVEGRIDEPRRRQLMQHHTATHLLNGALRHVLGPHVWQAGAYKGTDAARIDVTHFRALSAEELREVDRLVHRVIREDRPVKSYFETRTEAERRFGFTLYQGGAVPGRDIRIVEIADFDVEACGGTHCTRTGEVGLVAILGTERIQDGVVRLHYAAGERAVEIKERDEEILRESARRLNVPVEGIPGAIDRMQEELKRARSEGRARARESLSTAAESLLSDPAHREETEGVLVVSYRAEGGDRAGLQTLARELTRAPERVAVLVAEVEGRGVAFVGSTSARVPANAVLDAMIPLFEARGGGNPSAATAVGEPGEPLLRALERGRTEAQRRAAATRAASVPVPPSGRKI